MFYECCRFYFCFYAKPLWIFLYYFMFLLLFFFFLTNCVIFCLMLFEFSSILITFIDCIYFVYMKFCVHFNVNAFYLIKWYILCVIYIASYPIKILSVFFFKLLSNFYKNVPQILFTYCQFSIKFLPNLSYILSLSRKNLPCVKLCVFHFIV